LNRRARRARLPRRQAALAPDQRIEALLAEVTAYPGPEAPRPDLGALSMLSTVTVFGTALDITLAELSIEAFFPADAMTAETLRQAAERG
jgi:hypothetical protein